MQFKAFIKKKASEKNVSAQLVMQNYMLERLLERISLSKYQHNFIVKGGFLISAIVGLESRTTMDLDTTLKGISLNHEEIKKVFEEICQIKIDDDIFFEIDSFKDIRKTDSYPGIQVGLTAIYKPLKVPLFVDITTGDKITPREINYRFKLLFDDRSIKIMAYNLESLLAEKIETILSRSVSNTRSRDFYDIYILHKLQEKNYDFSILKQAIEATAIKRGSLALLKDYKAIIANVAENAQQQGFWKKYKKDYAYAQGIDWNDICKLIIELLDKLKF